MTALWYKNRDEWRDEAVHHHVHKAKRSAVVSPPRAIKGIGRQPREKSAASLPPTQPQIEVLRLLTKELQSASLLARTLGRPLHGVNASLYALAERGLAERVPYKGWRGAA